MMNAKRANMSQADPPDTGIEDHADDGDIPGSREQRIRLRQIAGHIGGRIRQRRTELGLTQEQLGRALGVSYQQIQKYETAANRISAGRLYELAHEFGVEPSYFFDGLAGRIDVEEGLPHGGHNRSAIELVRNYLAIDNDAVRAAVTSLLKALRDG